MLAVRQVTSPPRGLLGNPTWLPAVSRAGAQTAMAWGVSSAHRTGKHRRCAAHLRVALPVRTPALIVVTWLATWLLEVRTLSSLCDLCDGARQTSREVGYCPTRIRDHRLLPTLALALSAQRHAQVGGIQAQSPTAPACGPLGEHGIAAAQVAAPRGTELGGCLSEEIGGSARRRALRDCVPSCERTNRGTTCADSAPRTPLR